MNLSINTTKIIIKVSNLFENLKKYREKYLLTVCIEILHTKKGYYYFTKK